MLNQFSINDIFWTPNKVDGKARGTLLLPNGYAVNFVQNREDSLETKLNDALFTVQILLPIIAQEPLGLMESPTGTLMPISMREFPTDQIPHTIHNIVQLVNNLNVLEPETNITPETILFENTENRNEWLDITQFDKNPVNPDTGQIIPAETLEFNSIPQP